MSGFKARIVQKINEEIPRGMVGLLVSLDSAGISCHRVCRGGEGWDCTRIDDSLISTLSFCVCCLNSNHGAAFKHVVTRWH